MLETPTNGMKLKRDVYFRQYDPLTVTTRTKQDDGLWFTSARLS